jgi:phosphoribosylanthranilate isomerase
MRTRVKICGVTQATDARQASMLGADAIGLVFYSKSPRAVDAEKASLIVKELPAFVTRVGLFVNMPRDEIQAILQVVSLDLLQFHGDEAAADCRGYNKPYIKALRMKQGLDIAAAAALYPDAAALLLDTYQAGVPGGTGQRFDWNEIPKDLKLPLVLAGGLDATNVAEAITTVHPYAVDVSGGVERDKGIKDHLLIRDFITEVNKLG